jgi:hypothetical protein
MIRSIPGLVNKGQRDKRLGSGQFTWFGGLSVARNFAISDLALPPSPFGVAQGMLSSPAFTRGRACPGLDPGMKEGD